MEFQTLYQELVNSTEMIRALLADISQAEAQVKPSPGKWSILEVTCHLYDEEREDFREHLDFILHRQHEEWHSIALTAWVKLRKYNQQNFKTMQRKFFNEREKSLAWLKSLKKADWNTTYTSKFGSTKAGTMFASWSRTTICTSVNLPNSGGQELKELPSLIAFNTQGIGN